MKLICYFPLGDDEAVERLQKVIAPLIMEDEIEIYKLMFYDGEEEVEQLKQRLECGLWQMYPTAVTLKKT